MDVFDAQVVDQLHGATRIDRKTRYMTFHYPTSGDHYLSIAVNISDILTTFQLDPRYLSLCHKEPARGKKYP